MLLCFHITYALWGLLSLFLVWKAIKFLFKFFCNEISSSKRHSRLSINITDALPCCALNSWILRSVMLIFKQYGDNIKVKVFSSIRQLNQYPKISEIKKKGLNSIIVSYIKLQVWLAQLMLRLYAVCVCECVNPSCVIRNDSRSWY